MSGLLASAATNEPKLSQIARHRLHRAVDDAMDQGLLRLGWGISGIAASVLVVGSLWLMKAQSTPEAAPPWVGVSAVAEMPTRLFTKRRPLRRLNGIWPMRPPGLMTLHEA